MKNVITILLCFVGLYSCAQSDSTLLHDLSKHFKEAQTLQIRVDAELNKNTIYVSTGTELSLALTKLVPGQRLVLKEGHYTDVNFLESINGTPDKRITITAQGKVVVDCLNYMAINGSDVTVDGIEFYTDSWIGDRFKSVKTYDFIIQGQRTIMKNCVIHDFGNVGLWSNAVGSTLEGCLIYNIGYGSNSQGHTLYTQNADGFMVVRNNIFLAGNYTSAFCLHLYGSGGAAGLRGYKFDHNTFFGGRNLIGSGGQKVYDIYFNNNVLIKGNIELGAGGWATEPLHEFNLEGNRLWDAGYNIKKAGILNLTHTKATFGSMQGNVTNVVAGNIDYNTYIFYFDGSNRNVSFNRVNYNYVYGCCIDALQPVRDKLGWEVHSTEKIYPTGPPPDEIDVNVYEITRANVAIANYSLTPSVNVSLSGLDPGIYRAYNAQNPKEWFDFNFTGSVVNFPMTGWTISPPIGTEGGLMTQTSTMFPKFGIFYITKKP